MLWPLKIDTKNFVFFIIILRTYISFVQYHCIVCVLHRMSIIRIIYFMADDKESEREFLLCKMK